ASPPKPDICALMSTHTHKSRLLRQAAAKRRVANCAATSLASALTLALTAPALIVVVLAVGETAQVLGPVLAGMVALPGRPLGRSARLTFRPPSRNPLCQLSVGSGCPGSAQQVLGGDLNRSESSRQPPACH